MGTFYIGTVAFLLADALAIGYYVGRYVECRRHLTRNVTLSDFSKLTQSR